MDSMEAQAKFIYAILVVFLVLGVAAMAFVMIALDDPDSEYARPHDYIIESGTYMGHDASGTGHSDYYNESPREFVYRFVTDVSYGGKTESLRFDVICGLDKAPVDSIYKKEEKKTVSGIECTWWSYSAKTFDCRFAIDSGMVVRTYVLSDSEGTWSLTASLNDRSADEPAN